jgi:hypothetical protein
MNYQQERMLQTMQSMADTISARAELAPFRQTTAYKSLTTAIADLSAHASTQHAGTMGSRGETARSRSLRDALRTFHLQPIVAAARLCSPRRPELASIRMPRARMRVQSLLATTQAIIDTAHANEAAFVAAGLAPTFLTEIDAALRDLRASLDDRAQYSSRRNGATEGLRLTVQRAAQVIKIVNAQVKTLIGTDNGALLAQWEAATHVGRKPGAAAGSTQAGFSDTAGRYLPASPGIIRNFRNLASCITDTSS